VVKRDIRRHIERAIAERGGIDEGSGLADAHDRHRSIEVDVAGVRTGAGAVERVEARRYAHGPTGIHRGDGVTERAIRVHTAPVEGVLERVDGE
jgi:hypothetical protein